MTTQTSIKPQQVSFSKAQEVGERPWGKEWLAGHIEGVATLKMLEMSQGAKGGLQKHRLKNEAQFIFSGSLAVRFDLGDGLVTKVLGPGDCIHIPPGCVHQEEALTNCIIFEVSTPHFEDRVRMEEAYGLPIPSGGLPTTELEDIEVR